MSRCHQTDALLDAIFVGTDLTRAEAAHIAACTECARALALARRFDGELQRVGLDMSPEPLPITVELAVESAPMSIRGGRSMTWKRSLIGGVVAATLLVAVVFGGGQWLGSRFGGALQPGGIAPEDLNAWLGNALVSVIGETGRGARATDWEPLQVEECGTTAIAFWAERDPESNRAYRWAVGEPGRLPVVAAGGLTGSLSGAEVASLRASLPICSMVIDSALGEEQAREALLGAREAWGESGLNVSFMPQILDPEVLDDAQITGLWRMDRDLFGVVIAQESDAGAWLNRALLTRERDGGFAIQHSGFDPGAAEPLVVYRDPMFGSATFFAVTGDVEAAAVEFIGSGVLLRYPVRDSGFMLTADVPVDAVTEYRFLDDEGRVLATGRIELWCGELDPSPLPGC